MPLKTAGKFLVRKFLQDRVQEPSTYAGAAIAGLGISFMPETTNVLDEEFIRALAIVIAGLLSIFMREKPNETPPVENPASTGTAKRATRRKRADSS
jgi:hypothetical protein